MSCRDCETRARFPSWPGYTANCQACEARAFATLKPADEFEKRRLAWVEANPGAWPMEYRDACARLREEIGG